MPNSALKLRTHRLLMLCSFCFTDQQIAQYRFVFVDWVPLVELFHVPCSIVFALQVHKLSSQTAKFAASIIDGKSSRNLHKTIAFPRLIRLFLLILVTSIVGDDDDGT